MQRHDFFKIKNQSLLFMFVIYAKYKENRMEIDGVSKPLSIIFLEVYGPIFLGNSILKILLYIVHRHLSLTCTFRLIILCVSSEDLSEVLRRMSLLYFTFQNMKLFKGYLLFSPRKCNKKLRLSIRMSEN